MPTRPDGGAPPRPGRLGRALRAAGIVAAVALGGVAAWLIVTGRTQQRVQLGVLLGLWGALLGAYTMFSARHRDPGDAPEDTSAEPDLAGTSLERSEDAAVRQQYELRLEEMLRRQIQAALGPEVASLRAEVAALRSELVEKVGGQIRLERIETTRVIGSDIEALQQEVRQLKGTRPRDDFPDFGPPAAGLSDVAGAAVDRSEPSRVVAPTPAPVHPAPAAASVAIEATQVVTALASEPPAVVATAAPEPASRDPFAALPRLTRFTDFPLDPVEVTSGPLPATGESEQRRDQPDEPLPSPAAAGGRHAVSEAAHGGRRRRDPGGGDVLARILDREGAS